MTTALRKSARLPGDVGEPALAEHLQEQVEERRVGLLELVEQQDRERLFADPGREQALAPPGRSADQAEDGDRVGVLAHVEPGHASAVAEEELGERLGQLGLADARRADEHQRGDRLARPGQAGLDRRQQVHDQVDRLVLADHPGGEPAPGGVEVERGRVVEEHQRQAGLAPKARVTASASIGASSPAGWSWIRFVRNRRGRPG